MTPTEESMKEAEDLHDNANTRGACIIRIAEALDRYKADRSAFAKETEQYRNQWLNDQKEISTLKAQIKEKDERIIDLEESYGEASRIAHRQLNRVIPLEKEIESLKSRFGKQTRAIAVLEEKLSKAKEALKKCAFGGNHYDGDNQGTPCGVCEDEAKEVLEQIGEEE